MAAKGNAVIGQSGGPTSVINQSLVGAILEAKRAGHIDKFLGARHGVRGIVDQKFISLKDAPDELLERIALSPAAALGSTRDKPDQAYCEKIFEVFKKNDVRYFFYIGGNDSADTARIVQELGKQEQYDLKVFHIPKTIDNDLRVHDHTPGFGSAARFVAAAVLGDDFDQASLPGLKVNIIMGRHAGFLTAATVLGRRNPEAGPHLIYVPEAPISQENFLADVDAVYKKHGRCLISMSEGVCAPDGKAWVEKLDEHVERDAHGNLQLTGSGIGDFFANLAKTKLGIKRVRSDTFGYLQRSFPGLAVSDVDAREARLVGQMAVKYSADDANVQGSVAMRRKPGAKYQIETFLTPLKTVARETKHMDASYIEKGNNITQAFVDYASPIVGNMPVVGAFDEIRSASMRP